MLAFFLYHMIISIGRYPTLTRWESAHYILMWLTHFGPVWGYYLHVHGWTYKVSWRGATDASRLLFWFLTIATIPTIPTNPPLGHPARCGTDSPTNRLTHLDQYWGSALVIGAMFSFPFYWLIAHWLRPMVYMHVNRRGHEERLFAWIDTMCIIAAEMVCRAAQRVRFKSLRYTRHR